jgi:ADP-ribose pyrophosphatase YjhB (NUDIX family)
LAASLLALGLLILPASGSGQSAGESAETRYRSLVKAARAGDTAVDWQAMRFAYADQAGYMPTGEGDEALHEQAMRKAFNGADLAGAIAEAKLVLDQDFVDPEAHLIAAVAYRRSNDALSADREQAIGTALLKSVQTGDGRSAQTAYTVISVKEEYVLMAASGRRVTRQSLMKTGGHSYDVLETVETSGAAPMTFWFQIDRVTAAETHVFQLPTKP